MKRSSFLFTVIATGFLLISSCKSSTSSNSPPPAFTAFVNGQAWASGIASTQRLGNGNTDYGASNDSTSIDIFLSPAVVDTGMYSFNKTTTPASAAYTSPKLVAYTSTHGSLHLTKYSTTEIGGAFNFTGISPAGDSVVVTNGLFDMSR